MVPFSIIFLGDFSITIYILCIVLLLATGMCCYKERL